MFPDRYAKIRMGGFRSQRPWTRWSGTWTKSESNPRVAAAFATRLYTLCIGWTTVTLATPCLLVDPRPLGWLMAGYQGRLFTLHHHHNKVFYIFRGFVNSRSITRPYIYVMITTLPMDCLLSKAATVAIGLALTVIGHRWWYESAQPELESQVIIWLNLIND